MSEQAVVINSGEIGIIDALDSYDEDAALSAKMGKELYEKISKASINVSVSVGSMFGLFTKDVPESYLRCDGTSVLKSEYPALYQYMVDNGLPYGESGDYFNLPLIDNMIIATGA